MAHGQWQSLPTGSQDMCHGLSRIFGQSPLGFLASKGVELFPWVLRCFAVKPVVVLKPRKTGFSGACQDAEERAVVLLCGLNMALSSRLWFNENH